jgi:hypothetical protein
MPAIRFPIHRLMIWVSVAAINLAAFRALFATRNIILLAVGMLGFLTFQVGIFRAIRNRGGSRPYWLGFTGGGLIAMTSLIWAEFAPGGISEAIWEPYFAYVNEFLALSEPLIGRMFGNGASIEIVGVTFEALSCFLPLLVAGIAAGHLCRLLFRPRSIPIPAT